MVNRRGDRSCQAGMLCGWPSLLWGSLGCSHLLEALQVLLDSILLILWLGGDSSHGSGAGGLLLGVTGCEGGGRWGGSRRCVVTAKGELQLSGRAVLRGSDHHEVVAEPSEEIGEDAAGVGWTVDAKDANGADGAFDGHAAAVRYLRKDLAEVGVIGGYGQKTIL